MGNRPATGDKRALTAAEAAIANPLIDDFSTKGARGLLISITGGKDLTLFEVDEAATRICEEVDQDANIIVGATFDENLDGIIRVSVVATGIEQAQIARNQATQAIAPATPATPASPDNRLAELTARLRADNARLAERAQKLEPAVAQQAQALAAAAPPPAAPQRHVERAALAAIAVVAPEPAQHAPIQPASYGDVTVRPIAQKPTLFPDHKEAAHQPEQPAAPPETFIPQAAERAPVRTPRMPKFEDLPMPAQAEIRQARGDGEEEHPQKSKLSLLQRLANVGLGRRDEINACRSRPAPPDPPWRRFPSASRSARSPSKWRIRIRYRSMQTSGAAGFGRPWPPRTCCPGATGRRPS